MICFTVVQFFVYLRLHGFRVTVILQYARCLSKLSRHFSNISIVGIVLFNSVQTYEFTTSTYVSLKLVMIQC